MTMIFFAMTQGRVFLHPKDATNESFQKESLQKEPETEEFEKRLRILFVIWQVELMLNKIWTNQDKAEKMEKAPVKTGQEKMLTEIAGSISESRRSKSRHAKSRRLKMLRGDL